MAGGQERILRRRIKSVEATKKITRAFELIAASQIVRAQGRIVGSRPYVDGLRKVLRTVATEHTGPSRFLAAPDADKRCLLIVVAGDRGLCGGYNSIALRTAERQIRAGEALGKSYSVVTVGRKAESYFRFRHRTLASSFTKMSDRPSFGDARAVATAAMAQYLAGEIDVVEIVSWRFVSAGSQVLDTKQLLPFDRESPVTESMSQDIDAPGLSGFYDFEPDPEELLKLLLPVYAEAEIFQALLEASASEHTARQRAMAAATENAEDLITSLRRQMNRVRQEAITTEIMEIVGGAEALRTASKGHDFELGELEFAQGRGKRHDHE